MSEYISLDNLARYDGKIQSLVQNACAIKNAPGVMWRQTEKAGAVSFWPVGNSPLEGTVEFVFKETGPASGTKSPDNPSTISGVSSIGLTVCQEEGVDEHSYSLSLGSTFYGGSIDLATGLMTVTHWGSVFDGTENWEFNRTMGETTRFRLANVPPAENDETGDNVCSHLIYIYNGRLDSPHVYLYGTYLYIMVVQPDVASLKSWLATQKTAGTPIVVTYPLATPYTVQLSPPALRSLIQPDKYVPRLNTVYTGAENVQIVYQKNPVRDKLEKMQAIIAQGGNV